MNLIYNKKIASILAFAVFFSTVAQAYAFSMENTEVVVSSVRTSSNSGGQSGTSSLDGQDGLPGKNGQDGQSGSSGNRVEYSKSNASVRIESNTNTNGEQTVNIYKSTNVGDSASAVVETFVTDTDIETTSNQDDFATSTSFGKEDTSATETEVTEVKNIMLILANIRLILFTYVNKLF